MALSMESIENIVKNGLVPDIFTMDQSYELFMAIAREADEINSRVDQNYGSLFKVIQESLRTEMLLAVARVYDRPSNKYPIRCLSGLLIHLEHARNDLPSIREPIQLRFTLEAMNAPMALIDTITTKPTEFAPCLAVYFRELLEDASIVIALERAKYYRDKFVAHNEDTNIVPFPNMSSLKKLIDIAKKIVGALGLAYFGTAYIIDDRYLLCEDAHRASTAMTRLLNTVYGQA
jgi:AbiU2